MLKFVNKYVLTLKNIFIWNHNVRRCVEYIYINEFYNL